MNRYLCLRCWRIMPLAECSYSCPKCNNDPDLPSFARPDGDVPKPKYGQSSSQWMMARLLTDESPREPRCRIHPDTRVALYCECRARLDLRARMDADEPTGLGFAGPPSAGKTFLILSSVARLQGLDLAGRRVTLFGIGDTEPEFKRLAATLREGRAPKPTIREAETGGDPRNFCWELLEETEAGAKPQRMGLLAVYDLAGETWKLDAEEEFDRTRQPDRQANFLRYLERLKSLVFLVDGASLAHDLGAPSTDAWLDARRRQGASGAGGGQAFDSSVESSALLALIHSRLGEKARQIDFALTLSKTDLLWSLKGYEDLQPERYDALPAARRRDLVRQILEDSGRTGLLQAASRYFREVDLFGVSSIGFLPTPETVDAERLKRPMRPVGVDGPLRWLLSRDAETVIARP